MAPALPRNLIPAVFALVALSGVLAGLPAPGRADDTADLEAWVRMGAPDPRTGTTTTKIDPAAARDFWSFRPVRSLPAPAVKDTAWPLNDVDRFVLAKLEEKGLRPVAPADKRTL